MNNYENGTNDRFHLYSTALVERLKMMSGKQGQDATQFADDVCRAMLGTALDPEDYANLNEQQQFDFVVTLEEALNSADLVTMLFLVEKMTSLSNREFWDAIKLVDELSGIVLDACLGPENRASFERDNSQKLLLRANELLECVDDIENSVKPLDVVTAMLKCY